MPLWLPMMTRMENYYAWNTVERSKKREGGVFHFFLQLIVLDAIFTLAFPSSLPSPPCLDTINRKRNRHWAVNHLVRVPPQCSPLPLQFPLRIIHMSKHIYLLNISYNNVNHIHIAVSEIRGKNEITYAKTQIVHNLCSHMRNTIFRWHTPGFIWSRYIHA